MDLAALGFDSWFRERVGAPPAQDFGFARISRVDRDRYLAMNEEREVRAEPTGRLLFAAESPAGLPCVGDWVLAQYHNDGELAIVHEILPRRTMLRRKAAGDRIEYQMIAANIDTAFIVQACDTDFNLRRMERYLVAAAEGGVEPVILLSKSDLLSREELAEMVEAIRAAHIGARAAAVSSNDEAGLDGLRSMLEKGKTYCLLGSSGVGKTTLLNRLLGVDAYATAPIREKDGRGRHTTSQRQLVLLPGGALMIDTPGMRELGMLAAGEGIEKVFSGIGGLASSCRFADCTHTSETGCAVLEALESGELDEDAYRNYLKLRRESAYHEMSYAERRKKDKDFGRMLKKALDDLGKRKPRAS